MAQYNSKDKNKAILAKLEAKAARNKEYKNSFEYKNEIKRIRESKPSIGKERSKDSTKTSTWERMDQSDRAKMTELGNKGGKFANLSAGEQRTGSRAKKAALRKMMKK